MKYSTGNSMSVLHNDLMETAGFQHFPVASIEQSGPALTNGTAVFFSGIQFKSILSHLGGDYDLVLGFMA